MVCAATAAVAQQVKRVQNATITAQAMEFDWGANTIVFTGNVKLVMTGTHNATMTAPRMSVKLSSKAERVVSVVTDGPANFSIVTAPDSEGVRRKIIATASQKVTYSADSGLVTLTGGATADLLPVDAAPETEAIHFTGETITANLKTNKLTVDNANLTVETTAN